MVFLGVLIGIIIMGAMIYLALNKKSNFHIRLACLAALALMILTVIICLFIVFTDNRVPVDESVVIVGAVQETKKNDSTNIIVPLIFLIVMAAMFIVIAIISLKDQGVKFPKLFKGTSKN